MTSSRQAIYATLSALPALAGVPIRPLVAAVDDKPPFVIYSRITEQRVQSLVGDSGLSRTTWQIDVYATDPGRLDQLSIAIRQGLQITLQAIFLTSSELYDHDVQAYRQRTDYAIWLND